MSGIAAILERTGAPASEARIRRMLGRLRRRGPDRAGHHVDGSAALAQAMFETTPEDAFERQPLRSRSGERWIVADARIDNRRELLRLRAEAGVPSDPPAAVPDAELILWAYERWGEACPARLVGDFAFAIWDRERRCLFCARDPIGVRAFYYSLDGASFRGATEMDALFADERLARRPHRLSMALFLAHRYSERDETLYEGVHALPPGHLLTVTAQSIRREAYWRPDPWRKLPASSDDDTAARFREVFSEAVRCRLRANGPMAACVSGGLDSSSVACEGERLRREGRASGAPLILLRSAYPGLDCDERRYSDAVAAELGLPIETSYPATVPNICSLEQTYPDLYFQPVFTSLDPLMDSLRRRGVRAMLTGEGGDLLMQRTGNEGAHYLRAGSLLAALEAVDLRAAPLSPAAWRRLAGQGLRAWAPRAAATLTRRRWRARARWPWLSDEAAGLVDARIAAEDQEIRNLHPDLLTAETCHAVTHEGTPLATACDDRAGALQAIERRHPFYDVRVIELLLALPLEQRFTRAESKSVLRRALGAALPERVSRRRGKADFGAYVRRVFLEAQRTSLQRLFRGSLLEAHGLVDASALRALLEAPPEAQRMLGLADLTAMELWLRRGDEPILEYNSLAPHEDQHEVA